MDWSFLSNPQFQLGLAQFGSALSPRGIAGGKEYQTFGERLGTSIIPVIQGNISQQKAGSVEAGAAGTMTASQAIGSVGKMLNPTQAQAQNPVATGNVGEPGQLIPGKKIESPVAPKASDALGFDLSGIPGSALSSEHVTGITTKDADGKTIMVKSPGPKEYMEAQIIRDQQTSGQPASSYLGSTESPYRPTNPQENAGAPGAHLLPAVLKNESGGKDYKADGTPLVSPKGALYAMQVMPETARDPGFGIAPAKNNSPEEYNRVGREYLSAMYTKYGGDNAKALAAYNAGPDAVDQAIAKYGGNYLQGLPDETKMYVANAGAGGSGGVAPTKTMLAQAPANLGTTQPVVSDYQPPMIRPSAFLSKTYTPGLTTEQVQAATQTGLNAAGFPYDSALKAAQAKNIDVTAEATRLGLPTHAPNKVTLPGGQQVVTTGKEYLDTIVKMEHNQALQKYYEAQIQNAQSTNEMRGAVTKLREAQEAETKLKADKLKVRADMIEKMGEQIVTGSDLTYKQADSLGVLDDIIRQNSTLKGQNEATERQLAADARKIYSKLVMSKSDVLAGPQMQVEAKKMGITVDQYIALQMAQAYGPDWKKYLGLGQPKAGEKATVGPATFKFNPATGKIE